MSLLLAAAAVAVVCVSGQPTPSPPVIPLQWQAGMVQVFWSVNQTAPFEAGGWMYWDYTVDTIRQDFSMSGASFQEITTYATQTEYEISVAAWANNAPACVKRPSQGAMASRYVMADATYAGKQLKNDVECDVWWVVIPNPAPQPAENLTMWWNTPQNAPVEWTSVAIDGSSMSVVSLFQFQPNVNVPGNGLFAIPSICSSSSAAADAEEAEKPVPVRSVKPDCMKQRIKKFW